MEYQSVFLRYELKYLISKEKKNAVLRAMKGRMTNDRYSKSDIRNIYFDTPNYRLIRASIEKPIYKEKLRVRSYGKTESDTKVFVELKRKYNGIVYKRRSAMTESEAHFHLSGNQPFSDTSQINKELNYFLDFYGSLTPSIFLSYERESFCDLNNDGLRITFDENILCRKSDLTLSSEAYGEPILDANLTLMEIKCPGGLPLWLSHTLSYNEIYKTSFSKYGVAYKKYIFPNDTSFALTD